MLGGLDRSAVATLWPAILAMRRFLARDEARQAGTVAFVHDANGWTFLQDGAPAGGSAEPGSAPAVLVPLCEAQEAAALERVREDERTAAFLLRRLEAGASPFVGADLGANAPARIILRIYLPLVVGAHRARIAGRLFTTAHLAQTLDGRIACANGHSQWISNEANLHHSHRLRALHDAVVVGSRTVERDDPRLTVRHVEGEDPERYVLSSSARLLRSDVPRHLLDDSSCVVLVNAKALVDLPEAARRRSRVEIVAVEDVANGYIAPDEIHRELQRRGRRSAFVEGGGRTLSHFLEHGAIDVLHLHLAPMILGSGIHGFSLPEVARVDEGKRLRMEPFDIDGELLLECRVIEETPS